MWADTSLELQVLTLLVGQRPGAKCPTSEAKQQPIKEYRHIAIHPLPKIADSEKHASTLAERVKAFSGLLDSGAVAYLGTQIGRRVRPRPSLFRCIRIQEVENGCFKLLVCHFQHIQRVLLCL
jgi:hypothetical protein